MDQNQKTQIPVIEIDHVSKRFAKVLANDDVSIVLNRGEVVALLGENGAGKSTIMNILYGIYHMTSGQIRVDGIRQNIHAPKDAMALGISMIQQHFSLVGAHTVTENIILGNVKGRINYEAEERKVQELSDRYQFGVSARAKVGDLPVGMQQKVEIMKALYRECRILIMDEPTAVLMPQEIDTLMEFIRSFVAEGNSVFFITHKMREVMQVADRIVIMRNGRVSGTVQKSEVQMSDLARLMIGHDLEELSRSEHDEKKEEVRLKVNHVTVEQKGEVPLLSDIDFEIRAGEIFGVAGVSGNGQDSLCELLYGALKPTSGTVTLDGKDITSLNVAQHIALGIGYCASDRYRYGMVSDMSLSENMMLKSSYLHRWDKSGWISWKTVDRYTQDKITQYSIKAPDPSVTIGSLSGGNQQKAVVAREVDMGKNFVIFDQPTRGLDLGAINYVHKTILAEREAGKSILLVSTELSEVFKLSDRIAVICEGRFMGVFKNGELTTEQIGMLMAGVSIGDLPKDSSLPAAKEVQDGKEDSVYE